MVVKNRHEALKQRVWKNQHFRDTLEDLDSYWKKWLLCWDLGIVLWLLFSHLLGSKANSVAMILTEDPRFLHSEQCRVPLDLF